MTEKYDPICRCWHPLSKHRPTGGPRKPCYHRTLVGAYDLKRCHCNNFAPNATVIEGK